jgi:hypothetical protein
MPKSDDDIRVELNKLYGSQSEVQRLIQRVPMFGDRHRILSERAIAIKAEIRCMEWMLFSVGFNKRMISDEIKESIEKVYNSPVAKGNDVDEDDGK